VVHRIELADSSGLFLGEEQTTISRAHDAVSIVSALQRNTPRGSRSHDARNEGDLYVSDTLGPAALSRGRLRKEEKHDGGYRRKTQFHVSQRSRDYLSYRLILIGPK